MSYAARLTLTGALAVSTLALSIASYVALDRGRAFAIGPAEFAYSEGHEKRAVEALTRGVGFNSTEVGLEESRKAIALSPYVNQARLRQAYVDWKDDKLLDDGGLEALTRSYDLVPYDHEAAEWRIRFALENWDQLPQVTRVAVYSEATHFGRVRRRKPGIVAALRSVQNPAGQVRAALWLRRLPGKPTFFDHAARKRREFPNRH